ncbi:SNF2 family N-terminal domain-containing protein [Rhodocollybia butyracea]|uniref:SNF2 family N-terminal domain-containing protein n=1 Tax=Rhodocollybia butyracea TaxID=206335 RepID=A0A9P5UCS0_9AGAR|nr:SNF2 family N-terminal domain-containing protein [Rhodocollybia butyracea]
MGLVQAGSWRLSVFFELIQTVYLGSDAQFVLGAATPSGTPRVAGGGGFGLNYDSQTPVRAVDIGGPDQQLRMAEFVTQSINNVSHGLTVKTAVEKLGLEDANDILPGMNVRLLPHQLIGVSWMLEREKSKDRKVLVSDDMGLGKTVQMIATMAVNQPSLDDEDVPTTNLIVVPAALLQQWKEEIESKTNDIMTVHVHHGKDKLKKRSDIKNYDVIITTYQTLNGDFNIPKDIEPEEEADWLAKNGQVCFKTIGVLARTKFFRAVADEAQFIRNRGTRSSLSLAHVKATYRWMLTGTPVTNTLADIYGLLRFGHFRPWNDWNDFNAAKMQTDDPPLAGQRAQTILAPLLLRRTKHSTLEGEPILKLPNKEISLVKLDFTCYDSFEKQSKIRLNKFIRERTLVKNHSYVLVMILRLRQLCCHPYLILSQTDKYNDPTALMGGEVEKERARAIKVKGRPWVEGVSLLFLIRARANELLDYDDEAGDTASCPVCSDMFTPENGRVLTCGHEVCFDCILDTRNGPMQHDGIFVEGTEKENLEAEKKFEEANAKGYRKCPTCHAILDMGPEKIFKSAAFEPTDEELSKYADSERRRRRKESDTDDRYSSNAQKAFEMKGLDDSDDDLPDLADILRPLKKQKLEDKMETDDDDVIDLTMDDISPSVFSSPSKPGRSNTNKRKSPQGKKEVKDKGKEKKDEKSEESGLSKALVATWSKGDDDMEPSIKMVQLIEYIKEWEALGDKTICYSQWTSMLDLIEVLFSRHGIRSLRFDGKMDRTSRDRTLVQFRKADGPKVILISTKCGGVGLNLVAANRIVNMDLAWNYAAESQAYDRAHRIGQDKEVFVKRLVVRNTIEERLLQLQDVKTGLAEAALGEGTGTKLNKLSMKDIKFLFGMTKNNNNTGNTAGPSNLQDNNDGDDEDEE